MESKTCTAFDRLSDILDTLRQQCPWDRQQTMHSLRHLTIEEAHELGEAIVSNRPDEIKKELGDLVMHILFYCKIAEEQGLFSTADVFNTVCDKLVRRHPFIYHTDDYHGESWEQLKSREKDHRHVLDGVPRSLPTLIAAQRMQEKVEGIGGTVADSPSPATVPPSDETAWGDLLFRLVDQARRQGICADDALCAANQRFRSSIEAQQS